MNQGYKKLKFCLLIISLVLKISTYCQTISTNAVGATAYCQNENLNVSYTITGTYNPGNIFTAQLSDETGSFASPTAIGTLSSTTAGTINATLPTLLLTGTLYRIRVVSSNPVITGSDNGSNLTISGSTADPANFGNNIWHAYCYQIGAYNNNPATFDYSNYRGMYTESTVSFNSSALWAVNSSPSSAAGYVGCNISNDLQIVRYKREGFPCGNYTINVAGPGNSNGFDDAATLIIDGVTIWSNGGCCQAINNVWTGILGASSQVEFVWSENGGESYGRLTFVLNEYPTTSPDVTICAGSSTTLKAYGVSNYDWSLNTTHLTGPFNEDSVVCSPPGATPNGIETYTVSTFDAATGCTVSNTIDVTINPLPSTSVTPTSDAHCGAGTTDAIATGANTYTWSPMTGVTINSPSGHDVSLSPATTTLYTVTGSNNCASGNSSVTVTINVPTGDPNDFGSSEWTVYCYDGNNFNTFLGTYTHNTLNFDSRTAWNQNTSPSNAPSYSGCPIPVDNHSTRYKREGFPCGYYQVDIPNHDDDVNLIIDGISVFSQNSWFGNVYKANVWSGYLGSNSQIEYTVREFGGGSNGGLAFVYLYGPDNSANESVWHGSNSTDWFDASNWCNAVPSSTISGLIPAGLANYPVISGIGAVASDITILTGASLTISGTNELEVTGDWNNDGVFVENNSTISFTGTGKSTISGTGTNNFSSITFNKSIGIGGIEIANDLNISGNINFTNGILNTDGNMLILGAGSSVSNTKDSSHVSGQVRKIGNSPFTFPVGKNGTYRPIEISAPAVISDHFTSEYFGLSPDSVTPAAYSTMATEITLDHVSRCEFWILDRTNGSSDVSVTLSWDENSCGVTNLADLAVARWDGAQWTDHGNGGTTGSTTSGTIISSAAVTTFSPFTLASTTIANPLPIELLSFTAEVISKKLVELSWSTASEINNDFFTIESSKNADLWERVAIVKGAGNSSSIKQYTALDHNPYNGISYYRLKQTDFNGMFKYSSVITLNLNDNNDSYNVYPNPTSGVVIIDGYEITAEGITIYNASGTEITSTISIGRSNQKSITVDLSSESPGMYSIKFNNTSIKVYKY